MKMTIDEAIKQLETYTIPCGKYKVAYDLAIETMRKYEKIEQILKDIPYGGEATVRRIQEVVEDGKID